MSRVLHPTGKSYAPGEPINGYNPPDDKPEPDLHDEDFMVGLLRHLGMEQDDFDTLSEDEKAREAEQYLSELLEEAKLERQLQLTDDYE